MPSNDTLIHVKLEYDEVIASKRDIFASEIDILNIIKSMNKYIALRDVELDLRAQFYKEIKKIAMGIKLLSANLPHVKTPKILESQSEKPMDKIANITPAKNGNDLEGQLREIQRKLRAISG